MSTHRKHRKQKPGFVYLMYDFRRYKFGITTNIERRLGSYITENPDLHCVEHRQVANYSEAQKVEKELKLRLQKFKSPTPKRAREWCVDDPEVPRIWRDVLRKYEIQEQRRREAEEQARRQRDAEQRRREAEEQARRQRDAEQRRQEAEEQARRQKAEEQRRREAEEQARRQRDAEQRRREAEEQARRDTDSTVKIVQRTVAILKQVATLDSPLNAKERTVILFVVERIMAQLDQCISEDLINDMIDSKEVDKQHLNNALEVAYSDQGFAKAIFIDAMRVCSADHSLTNKQSAWLQDFVSHGRIEPEFFGHVHTRFFGIPPEYNSRDKAEALLVMGLPNHATEEDIKNRYRELCKKHHPDRHSTKSDDIQTDHARKFKQVQEAFELLYSERVSSQPVLYGRHQLRPELIPGRPVQTVGCFFCETSIRLPKNETDFATSRCPRCKSILLHRFDIAKDMLQAGGERKEFCERDAEQRRREAEEQARRQKAEEQRRWEAEEQARRQKAEEQRRWEAEEQARRQKAEEQRRRAEEQANPHVNPTSRPQQKRTWRDNSKQPLPLMYFSSAIAIGVAFLFLVINPSIKSPPKNLVAKQAEEVVTEPYVTKKPVIRYEDHPKTIVLKNNYQKKRNSLNIVLTSYSRAEDNLAALKIQLVSAREAIPNFRREQNHLLESLSGLKNRIQVLEKKATDTTEKLNKFSADYPSFKATAHHHAEKERKAYIQKKVDESLEAFRERDQLRKSIGALPSDQSEYQRLGNKRREAEKESPLVYDKQYKWALNALKEEEKTLLASVNNAESLLKNAKTSLAQKEHRLAAIPRLIAEAERECEVLPAKIEDARNHKNRLKEDVGEATSQVEFAEQKLQQHARDFIG